MQQVEIDTEKHILTQTKKLSDGSYEKIFSRNSRGPAGYFTYNCHLCGVPNLPGEKALQTHITGKKHQNRLLYNYTPEAVLFRSFIGTGKNTQIIFPGEPIPPGFEDEMKPICQMDAIIEKIEKPLIGLEYILELHDLKAKEALYVCTLCDKRCDPRNIIPQITSHRHRMKYLDLHFPKIMNILNRESRFNTDMSYREEVLTKIAKSIEEQSKRQKPTVHDYKKYEISKNEITEEIKNLKHFDESDFPDADKIFFVNTKTNDLLDDVSSGSDSDFEEYNEKSRDFVTSDKKKSSFKFADARPEKSNEKSLKELAMSSKTTELPQKAEVKKILTPRELSEQSNAKMQEKYTIEKYKATVSIAIEGLEKKFIEYNKNPEKHPKYSEEWKGFWSRRYKELMSQGRDANSHDYKQEWILFWMNRMKELHADDIKSKKNEIRRKLNLTQEFVTKIEAEPNRSRSRSKSPVHHRSKSPNIRTRSPKNRTSRRSRSPARRSPLRRVRKSRSPIEISDESDGENYRKSSRYERKRFRYDEDRSHSRISDSPNSYRSASNFRDIRRSPSPDIYCKDGEINLVSVCRLLSALESDIGILAERVICLLTKAIGMEKAEANSCDNLLFENDNMILMETVKERLKGGLSANLVASHKIPAVKRAIQQIASLIYETNKKKQAMPVQVPVKMSEPTKREDVNEAARLEIARVLTQSLIEQGRDDITPEELEEMIEAFIQEGLETAKDEDPAPQESRPTTPTLSPQPSKSFESKTIDTRRSDKDDTFTELENLTDDDLKTLLRNFSDLTCDEQNHLITYLSKIENTDRQRVERLRKYVDIGDDDIESEYEHEEVKTDLPMDTNKNLFRKSPEKAQVLSDDEYEDTEIVKSMNATVNIDLKPQPINPTLSNTGAVANELMSSLMTSFMQTSSWEMPVQQPPTKESWDMPMNNEMQYQMPNMMVQQPFYNQPLPMHNMNTVSPWQQPVITPPSMQEMPNMPFGQYPPRNAPRIDPNIQRQNDRRRLERPNNTQLTGKGKNRR
ncbi:unnamed protein product [Chironomus riparius]|uniref:Uncharacterized protein n=1 Tax=Chironomus riparius TaxID=315576 RepID=A0A9N9S729_9DIPT|nr:unnamed protein product [Chironomus riparius]